MKKIYIKPETTVIILKSDEICDSLGVGSPNQETPDQYTKGTSTWDDDNDWDD